MRWTRRGGLGLAAAVAMAGLLASAFVGCGGPSTPTDTTVTVTKIAVTSNPTGLSFGFYEDANLQANTLPLIGKRPYARDGYEHWAADELTPGVYNFLTVGNCQSTHAYGERLIASVGISTTVALSGIASDIPAFYPQDITDPTTRAAAKAYLYAYIQAMLKGVGNVSIAIDNEMVSNWRLDNPSDPADETRAATWGAWYLEAAATARQAASDLGMSAQLKLVPIVNGDPFVAGNPIFAGPATNAWLVNAVAASDGLAIDSYHSDPNEPVTDPDITINTIQFWIDNYSAGKPTTMTENGFDTITQIDPTVTRDQRQDKLTGTEADQATYFGGLMPKLLAANAPGGIFHNQLRAFSIWSSVDNGHAADEDDIYYGLIRQDNSYKPAAALVAAGIEAIEADPVQKPSIPGTPVDVTSPMATTGVPVTFTDGDTYEYLHYVDTQLPVIGHLCRLTGTVSSAGSLLVHLNDVWKQVDVNAGSFEVQFEAFNCNPDAGNIVDVFAPAASFPFTQTVTNLQLATK